ncbi:MAG: nuclear transport factor 2 family protein [Dehalococcoidia bacterium]
MNPKFHTSPLAMAVAFIDCINRGDVEGLVDLMHEDHELRIFDEAPAVGREANEAGWRGYAESFPKYLILPQRMAASVNVAAVLGTTTGSHLGLPDEEESKLTLIWLSELRDGKVFRWELVADTQENRARYGLAG